MWGGKLNFSQGECQQIIWEEEIERVECQWKHILICIYINILYTPLLYQWIGMNSFTFQLSRCRDLGLGVISLQATFNRREWNPSQELVFTSKQNGWYLINWWFFKFQVGFFQFLVFWGWCFTVPGWWQLQWRPSKLCGKPMWSEFAEQSFGEQQQWPGIPTDCNKGWIVNRLGLASLVCLI